MPHVKFLVDGYRPSRQHVKYADGFVTQGVRASARNCIEQTWTEYSGFSTKRVEYN